MLYHVLAVGDVVSEPGLRQLERHLRPLQKLKNISFTVVNGENVSGVGLTPDQAEDLFAAGADVITLGNHTWGKMQIADYLEDSPYILRPANFSPRTPGRGVGVYDCGRFRIMQQVGMTPKEVKATIRTQVLLMFFLPLVTAAIHIAFAFPLIKQIVFAFGLQNVHLFLLCTLGTFGVFALLYTFVYLLTARTYYRIVRMTD